MKKALVFYLYGTRNAGDMAICMGCVGLLKKQDYAVTMVSRFSESEDEYFTSRDYIRSYYPDVEVVPGPFSFERDFSPVRKLLAYGASFARVSGILKDDRTKKLIAEHDIVFFNGGNLLRGDSLKDYLRLMALFYPVRLSAAAGKKVICLPQSTAGISRTGKRLLGSYLRYFSEIYIREERSLKAMKRTFPDIPFTRSTDLAFFCGDTKKAEAAFTETYPDLSPLPKTALVLRDTGIGDIGKVDPDTRERLLYTLRSYVESHPEKEYWVVVQTLKDREVSESFVRSLKGRVRIRMAEDHDPLRLRELYRHMDLLITMRLHAGILALSAHVPVAGLFCRDWGLKNPGMMETFGMPCLIAGEQEGDLEALIGRIPAEAPERIRETIEGFRDTLSFK